MKQAGIITIGDELLIGQVIDSNSAWIGTELNNIGIAIRQRLAVGDDATEIVRAINDTKLLCDIIILTGGLGPTKDDITKQTLANYFNVPLVINEEVLHDVKVIFERLKRPLLEVNMKQASVPQHCTVIRNELGTAPGMWFDADDKILISMPGVPFEMKNMMSKTVLPKLQSLFTGSFIKHKTFLTAGIGESFLAEKIESVENNLPSNIKLAYLPNLQQVRLRLTAKGTDEKLLETQLEKISGELLPLIQTWLINDKDELLEASLGKLLLSKQKTMATAESCTGGAIAARIVSVAGSSAYFRGSFVAYDYDAKSNLLDVRKETILNKGAVSEETVIEMANGALKKFGADYAVAVSGIAGPGGGLPNKPVGTVWIAVASSSAHETKEFHFLKNREQNIQATVFAALNFLFRFVEKDSIHK